MKKYSEFTKEELLREKEALLNEYNEYKSRGLKLDLSRGKPNSDQLDISLPLLSEARPREKCFSENGVDCRNYGVLDGIPEMKRLFAEMLGIKTEYITVGGNSSLQLMYDTLARAMLFGVLGSERPWCREEKRKWICVTPGYDRHFKMTEVFGFKLLSVPMTATGPDMDMVEEFVKDPTVKGIWCVPKYSNPDGIIYSDETIDRLAAMETAAPDFTIMWDNAYCVHEFEGEFVPFRDMISVCAQTGNPNRVIEFASTSKITLAGGGISVMAASEENIKYLLKLLGNQIISYDKVNQLRHVRYLKDKAHTLEIMKEHAALMAPKFRVVLDMLEQEIAPLKIARWNRPKGGYFVSFNAMPGTAKRTLQLCKEAGVTMTDAGATFPYGIDPQDSNIRIAPSLPPVEELDIAIDVFCTCLKLAALEKLMA